MSEPILSSEQREQLEALVMEADLPDRLRRRARLLLLYDQGLPTREVAERVHLSPGRVRFWRRTFWRKRMEIFANATSVGAEAGTGQSQPSAEEEVLSPKEVDWALDLFDLTRRWHRLNDAERQVVAAAAELEAQQGWPSSPVRASELPVSDLDTGQRLLLAAALGLPQGKGWQKVLAGYELGGEAQRQARILSAILRTAHILAHSAGQEICPVRASPAPNGVRLVVIGPEEGDFTLDKVTARSITRLWSRADLPPLHVTTEAQAKKQADGEPPLPEPRASIGVLPDDPLAEAGRKVLLFHFAEMLKHEAGTRQGEDIEDLHKMRVATRRMRAAFEVFGEAFKKKALEAHLPGLKATGRALGKVRDLDVLMEAARHYRDTLPEENRSGLDPLLDSWKEARQEAREEMLAYLDSADYAEFKQKFNRFLQTPGAGARRVSPDDPTPNLVQEVVPALVYTRLGAVRAYDSLLEHAQIEQLHALRIEFKKLRYAMEFFQEVLGPEAEALISDLKKLQDHLGELHDAQVATEILLEFLDEWEERQEEIPISERQSAEELVNYLAARHADRHALMISFHRAWDMFNRPEFRRNLALAVSVL